MKTMKNILLFSIVIYFFQINHSVGQCSDPNRHSPFYEDSWLSCEISENPNSLRPESHWIQYDLGATYVLDSIYIWNYNFWGYQLLGAKTLAIDYSTDGVSWASAGEHEIPMASGSYKYAGVQGPILDDIPARFVLLTVLENWGGLDVPCAGLSEIKFGVNKLNTSTNPDLEIDVVIDISPNPTADVAYLSVKGKEVPRQIFLTDVNGKELMISKNIDQINTTIDLSTYPSGIYFVRVLFDEGQKTVRLVKQDD